MWDATRRELRAPASAEVRPQRISSAWNTGRSDSHLGCRRKNPEAVSSRTGLNEEKAVFSQS